MQRHPTVQAAIDAAQNRQIEISGGHPNGELAATEAARSLPSVPVTKTELSPYTERQHAGARQIFDAPGDSINAARRPAQDMAITLPVCRWEGSYGTFITRKMHGMGVGYVDVFAAMSDGSYIQLSSMSLSAEGDDWNYRRMCTQPSMDIPRSSEYVFGQEA